MRKSIIIISIIEICCTYSTVLLQAGGLLIVMNTQLARMVIMMNMLNNLVKSQGKKLTHPRLNKNIIKCSNFFNPFMHELFRISYMRKEMDFQCLRIVFAKRWCNNIMLKITEYYF